MVKAASIVALCLIWISNSAFAIPILQGPPDGATGILGLEIDGVVYDVNFSEDNTSYEDFYGSDTPAFLADPIDLSAPRAAAASVAGFLIANSVTNLAGFETVTPGFDIFTLFIPTFIDPRSGPDLISAINITFRDGTWDSGGRDRLQGLAAKAGMKLSAWVRKVLLDHAGR